MPSNSFFRTISSLKRFLELKCYHEEADTRLHQQTCSKQPVHVSQYVHLTAAHVERTICVVQNCANVQKIAKYVQEVDDNFNEPLDEADDDSDNSSFANLD